MGVIGGFQVKFLSECWRLNEKNGNAAETHAYWSWDDDSQVTIAQGYKIRDPATEFYLPYITPELFSGESYLSRCGTLEYFI